MRHRQFYHEKIANYLEEQFGAIYSNVFLFKKETGWSWKEVLYVTLADYKSLNISLDLKSKLLKQLSERSPRHYLFESKSNSVKNLIKPLSRETVIRKISIAIDYLGTDEDKTPRGEGVYLQRLKSPLVEVIKVGRTRDPYKRVKQQQKTSMFNHELVYWIPTKSRTISETIERLCQYELQREPIKKGWLPDGYSECFVAGQEESFEYLVLRFDPSLQIFKLSENV